MNQPILLYRSGSVYANETAAWAALDAVTHKKGQPIVAFYTLSSPVSGHHGSSTIGAIFAIGIGDGVGQYKACTSHDDMLIVAQSLNAHITQFNKMFEYDANHNAIKAKLDFYTTDGKSISAGGIGSGSSASLGALYQLVDVMANSSNTGVEGAVEGSVLAYDATAGKWKAIAQSKILPDMSGYYTKDETDSAINTAKSNLQGQVDTLKALIPATASADNQLADKDFVNSSIATATAEFKGSFTSLDELKATSGNLNDYAFYLHTDDVGNKVVDRYKWTTAGWLYEYTLNNSSFTAEQWAALNSAITATLVQSYNSHLSNSIIHITAAERNAWNNKWDYDEETIKSVKVDSAASADVVSKTYANQSINFAIGDSKIRLISSNNGDALANGFPLQYVGGISAISSYVGWQMVTYADHTAPNPYFRYLYSNNNWSDWKRLAFLTDNVASATKLATARKIWGQSFDGTENVNGYMVVDGPALFNNYNATGNKSIASIIINKGSDYFGIGTSTSSVSNIAFGLCNSNWDWTSEQMVITYNGNILIGTTTDNGYKLDVNGKGHYSGDLIVGGEVVAVAGEGTPAGVTDYSALTGKPAINGVTLVSGNNTLAALGIQAAGDYATNSGVATLLADYATKTFISNNYAGKAAFNSHTADTDIHITAAERNAWNAKWNYDEATIKAVKVTSASSADSVAWSGITGKPTTFTPSAHTHTASEISGLPTNLSAFTNDVGYITGITKSMVEGVLTGDITSHTHTFASLTSKPTTIAGYGITDKVAYRETWNNFMHGGNEFTFASPAYSGSIWINYKTASGDTDGAITEYRFAKGAGSSLANIRAAGYIVDYGTSSQFLKADGSLDSNTYLNTNNYNSYAPTLTGTGASGTWGISISGNAASAQNLTYSNGIMGATVGSNGNVTIGSSDLAGTDAKLLVDGNAVIGGAITIDKKDTLLSLYSLTEAGIMLQSDGSGGDVAAIYEHKGKGNGLTFGEADRDFIWRTGVDAYKGGGGGTERMRLTNSGNLLIGTTTDNGYKLQVGGSILSSFGHFGQILINKGYGDYTGARTIETNTAGAMLYINYYHNGGLNLCQGGGYVGIGTVTPQYKLDVNGKGHFSGDLVVDGEVSALVA